MKKQLYTLGMLAILGLGTFVNAQVAEGVVGINTENPEATLDVRTKTGTTKSLKVVSSSNQETVTVLDNGKVGIGESSPKGNLEIYGNDWSEEETSAGKKNLIRLNLAVKTGSSGETKKSISSTWLKPNYVGHSIDFGLINTSTSTNPFMAFSVAPFQGYPSDQDMTIERMRITSTGNIGIGTTNPTEKLEVSGSIKSSDLAGTGIRNVVADANGKLVVGEATSSDETLVIKKTVKVVPNTVDTGNGLANAPAEGKNLRNYDGTGVPDYADSDYMIVLTNSGVNGNLQLPKASENPGRIIYLINGTTSGLGFSSSGPDEVYPFNFGTIATRSGVAFVSTGKIWYPIGR